MPARRVRGDASPSKEAIAAAAVAYVDGAELETLSVRGLAEVLGSFHANLYRRIASKDELLDLVAAAIYAEAGPPPRVDRDPRSELVDYAARLRAAWLNHPKAFPLLPRYRGAPVLAALDGMVGALLGLGLDHDRVRTGLRDYLGHVYGSILVEALTSLSPGPEAITASLPDYPNLYLLQTDPDSEHLAGSHSQLADEAFRAGINRILDSLSPPAKKNRWKLDALRA